MKTYIIFLRGINVGGQKKVKMADLLISLQKNGFTNAQNYIQSGNLIVKSAIEEKTKIAKHIEKIILDDFEFEVPTLVTSAEAIAAILANNPFFGSADDKNLYFTLLHSTPKKDKISNLNAADYPNERFHITENCVFLDCTKGAGRAKLNNNVIEQKLGVVATTRNLRTLSKMLELSREV